MTKLSEFNIQYIAMREGGGPQIPITIDQASQYNKDHGIFWIINEHENFRDQSTLIKVNAWYVDLDKEAGTKAEQIAKIKSRISPSMIIETKNGFHCYWFADNSTTASIERFKAIGTRLVHCFKADPKCKNSNRLLRAPGFNHLKDPQNPFPIKIVKLANKTYSEREMEFCFEGPKPKTYRAEDLPPANGDNIWEKARRCDQIAALKRVSGKACVKFESYDFKLQSNGNINLWVNGKSTHVFIANNEIKALPGGPTIACWIDYFWNDWKKTRDFLIQEFPEWK